MFFSLFQIHIQICRKKHGFLASMLWNVLVQTLKKKTQCLWKHEKFPSKVAYFRIQVSQNFLFCSIKHVSPWDMLIFFIYNDFGWKGEVDYQGHKSCQKNLIIIYRPTLWVCISLPHPLPKSILIFPFLWYYYHLIRMWSLIFLSCWTSL